MKIFLSLTLTILLAVCATSVFATIGEQKANFLAGEGIIVNYSNNPTGYRLGDKILRQEMVAIALKIKWVEFSSEYTCKKYFADVVNNNWECQAIETAADHGVISRENKNFRPKDFVTRAEALTMLSGISCLQRLTTREYGFLESAYPALETLHTNKNDWQKVLWETVSYLNPNEYGLSSMNSGDWTDAEKKLSNNPNDVIVRSEVFANAEFFLSYQKAYGGCEKTARLPIIYSEDEIVKVLNKTTGETTSTGTYTVQYPDALVSGEVRYAGVNKGGLRTSIPFYWNFKTSTKTPLMTQKKLWFFSIGSSNFAVLYGYEASGYYQTKIFEYGNYGVRDVPFFNPAKKIDISSEARAAGGDNPGYTEYTTANIKVEGNSLFLETDDIRRLKKFQYSDGVFVRFADIVL